MIFQKPEWKRAKLGHSKLEQAWWSTNPDGAAWTHDAAWVSLGTHDVSQILMAHHEYQPKNGVYRGNIWHATKVFLFWMFCICHGVCLASVVYHRLTIANWSSGMDSNMIFILYWPFQVVTKCGPLDPFIYCRNIQDNPKACLKSIRFANPVIYFLKLWIVRTNMFVFFQCGRFVILKLFIL